MKRILWLSMCLCLLLCMAACDLAPASPEPETLLTEPLAPEVSTAPTVESEPQGLEAFDGFYCLDENSFVQVRSFGGFMTLEYVEYDGEEISDTWVQEFWPDAGAIPADPYQGISGKLQMCTSTQQGPQFLDMPKTCTVCTSDTGICLVLDDETVALTTADDFAGVHTPWQELQQMLNDMTPCSPGEGPAGTWYSWNGLNFIYAQLDEDGHFFWLNKPNNSPAEIYEGGWSVTEDNCVTVLAEMLGAGQFPQEIRISWEYNPEGFLYLEDSESPLMYDEGGYACLYPYNPQMQIAFGQLDGLCYVKECWGISEAYTDEHGNDVYYNYNLPSFLGETDTVNGLNKQIQTMFGTMIDSGYEAVLRGEEPYCNIVYWEKCDMVDVMAIIIDAETTEGEHCVAYYYDTATDRQLYGADVLAKLGVDETTYLEGLHSAMQEQVYTYFDDPDSAEAKDCIDWMLSDDNLNLDRAFGMDDYGELFTYVQFETPTATWWTMLYPLQDNSVG